MSWVKAKMSISMICEFRVWHKEEKRFLSRTIYIANENEIIYSPDGYGISYLEYPEEIDVSYSTGLKDRDKHTVYFGDIIKDCDGDIYIVAWDEVAGHIVYEDKDAIFHWKEANDMFLADCEVIGNIYENPELLEKKEL